MVAGSSLCINSYITHIHTYTIDGMGHKSFLIFVEVYLNELVMFQNKSCNKYVYQTCLVLVVYVHVFDTLNFQKSNWQIIQPILI